MLSSLPSIVGFVRPDIDWHAVAPELTLLGVGAVVTLLDIVLLERGRAYTSALAGIGLLVALIPIVTLAAAGDTREMFGDAFVVDDFALILKAMFIVVAYIVVLLSTNYIAEGDYWENEYYGLLLASVMGMVLMASARDLVTIFVALELLSIPAYLMAAWRKGDPKSNEAGLKYYLMGVFASAIMLYGMSLLFGLAGDTRLEEIAAAVANEGSNPVVILGIIFVIVGFAFKVSGFPFHTWAPDTYEGAPTPVTAFLAVASKAAGFVALMQLVHAGFPDAQDIYQPLLWILAVGSMTAGNLIALRQENIVRLMAYSGVSQAGFMLAPLAVAGDIGGRGPLRGDHLRVDLRGHEPGRFRGDHRRGPPHRLRRDPLLLGAVQVRPRHDHSHDDLPVLPGRNSRRWAAGSPSSRCSGPWWRPTPAGATPWPPSPRSTR